MRFVNAVVDASAFGAATVQLLADSTGCEVAYFRDAGARTSIEAAMAKLYSSEIAVRASEDGVQIHGGYGFVKDYLAEKFFRDVKLTTIGEGTSEIQRLVIARHLMAGDRDSIQVQHWRGWSAERGVRFVDAFAPFFREPDETALHKYYIEGDVHFSEAGNRLIYETVRQAVGGDW